MGAEVPHPKTPPGVGSGPTRRRARPCRPRALRRRLRVGRSFTAWLGTDLGEVAAIQPSLRDGSSCGVASRCRNAGLVSSVPPGPVAGGDGGRGFPGCGATLKAERLMRAPGLQGWTYCDAGRLLTPRLRGGISQGGPSARWDFVGLQDVLADGAFEAGCGGGMVAEGPTRERPPQRLLLCHPGGSSAASAA